MSKYVIIDAEAIQKRIEELENKRGSEECSDPRDYSYLCGKIHQIEQVLLFSTPLIPEIEKAHKKGFTEGTCFGATTIYKYETSEDYISNLKLDI